MAIPYVTGPVSIWCGTGANGAAEFLGHSESGVSIDTREHYDAVMNDLGGAQVPFDMTWQGAEAFISGVLTRWNETIFAKLELMPNYGANTNAVIGQNPVPRGTRPFGALGSLMGTEQRAVQLFLVFTYASKAVFAANGMEPGRRYPFAMLQTNRADPLGTRNKKRHVAWHCINAWTPANGGTGVLWDYTLTGTSAAVPN